MATPGAVASGERSVAVGGDVHGLIVTGDHVRVVVKDGGAVGSILDALGLRRIRTRRRRTPVDPGPLPFADLVGRGDEIAALIGIDPRTPLSVIGEALVGKTYVVRSAVADPSLPLRDGAVLVHGRGRRLDDVLQNIWEAFVETKPPSVPGRTQICLDLAEVQALVVIDPCELEHDEAQELARALPQSRVIVVSRRRRWHDGHELAITGLTERDAIILLARELGRDIAADDPVALSACRAVGGHPLRIRQAAALIRTGRTTLEDLARLLSAAPAAALAERVVATATPSERELLTLLASFGGEPVNVELLEHLAGADAASTAAALANRHVVVTGSPRYGLPAELEPALTDAGIALAELRAAKELASIAESDPDSLVQQEPALLELLQRLNRRRHYEEAVRLGRAIAPLLVRSRRLGAWTAVTALVLEAASQARDLDGQAWALHERGTSNLVRGDVEEGRAMLRDAIELREQLRDAAGAAASRHNLGLRLTPPWYLQRLLQLPLLVVTGLIVTLIAAAGGGSAWLLTQHDDSRSAVIDSTSATDPTGTTRETTSGGTSGSTSTETTETTETTDTTETTETTETTDTTDTTDTTSVQETTEQGSTQETGVSDATTQDTQPQQVALVINVGGEGHGTIDTGIDGLICSEPCRTSVEQGHSVSLTAKADGRSIFTTWGSAQGCADDSDRCDIAANARVELAPRFEPAVTLSLAVDGDGSISVGGHGSCTTSCDYTVRQGTTVDLQATGLDDSMFAAWTGGRCKLASCSLQLDTSARLSARFEGPQLLTVQVTGDRGDTITSKPDGISCKAGGTCSHSFPWGTSVTLHPEPSQWFQTWAGGNCPRLGDCTVVLKSPTAIRADFVPTPP